MNFSASVVRQGASGGSYVVKYEADLIILLHDNTVHVEIISTIPEDASQAEVELAARQIRRGVEAALRPSSYGARIRISGLVIHPVDFSPVKIEQVTTEEVLKAVRHITPPRQAAPDL